MFALGHQPHPVSKHPVQELAEISTFLMHRDGPLLLPWNANSYREECGTLLGLGVNLVM